MLTFLYTIMLPTDISSFSLINDTIGMYTNKEIWWNGQ